MRKQTVVVGGLVVVIVCLFIARPNATQTRGTPTDTARRQIVNGTPEVARNIMLLDTQTGDSWITCHDSQAVVGWCMMFRGGVQAGKASSGDASAPGTGVLPKCLHYDKTGLFCTEYEKP
jgi:hypothetical protein